MGGLELTRSTCSRGWLSAPAGLLPPQAPESFLATGSQVGIVLLLLVLGLEYTADELITNLRRQAPVGVLDLLRGCAGNAKNIRNGIVAPPRSWVPLMQD